jgi:hypothetical protein
MRYEKYIVEPGRSRMKLWRVRIACSIPKGYEQHSEYVIHIKVKGKAIPLQALTGPEGSRRLKFPDFKTIGT